MIRKKIHVQDLRIGMYVAEPDRPWLDTPFLFQGFPVRDEADIRAVREICNYVFIDLQKGLDVEHTAPALATSTVIVTGKDNGAGTKVPVEEEFEAARDVRDEALAFIEHTAEAARHGKAVELREAKRMVGKLVVSITRNPDAQLCLTQLKDRDQYTAQHSINVCVLALALGQSVGMPADELNQMGLGALLHDIGKLRTPLEILNKPAGLTAEELEIMKTHTDEGKRILERSGHLPDAVVDIAYSHHERLGGTGYPRKLVGEHITFWSRLVAVVDVFDAITSDRAYHSGLSAGDAVSIMYERKGQDFDAGLIEEFIRCIGVFPIGSLVEMTSGELGVVISNNRARRLRPKVMLVRDEQGKTYSPLRIHDLALTPVADYGIRRVLEPGARGLEVKDLMGQIGVACQR